MRRAIACRALLLPMAVAAQRDEPIGSDRPGIADGAEVVGMGVVQLETGVQRETRRAGEPPEHTVFYPTLLRLGLGQSWEARVESDLYASMRSSGVDGGRMQAVAPVSLGFKIQFLEADARRPSLGVIVRVSPPSGTKALRTRRTTGEARLVADWEFAPGWFFNPNVGVALDEDDDGKRFGATLLFATLSYKPVPSLELFVDGALQRPEARGAGSGVVFDAGLAFLLGRDVQVDLSAGARRAGGTPPRRFFAAGISVRF